MQGLFVSPVTSHDGDAELDAVRNRVQTSIALKSKLLGKLVYDRGQEWFVGKLKVVERRIPVFVEMSEPERLVEELPSIEQRFVNAEDVIMKMATFATEKLLLTKNESWLSGQAKPLTAEEFMKQLKLDAMILKSDRSIQVCFRAGRLFHGHDVHVYGTMDSTPTFAEVVG